MASAIQFRGKETVMAAYSNRGVDAWSIWQGKQFMFKGTDQSELENILDSLMRGSDVIYTLKVYEDITDATKIKSNTPDDGSFNFKLHSDTGLLPAGTNSEAYINRLVEEKIAGIVQPEPEPETFTDALGNAVVGMISTPGGLVELLGIVREILKPADSPGHSYAGQGNGFQNAPRPAAVGRVQPTNQHDMNEDLELQGAQITSAVERLYEHDKKIAVHLEKLANMADKDPGQFKFLLSMLDKMK